MTTLDLMKPPGLDNSAEIKRFRKNSMEKALRSREAHSKSMMSLSRLVLLANEKRSKARPAL